MTAEDHSHLSAIQSSHYDRIAEGYEAHYSDHWSLQYRDRFINPEMTAGIPLRGQRVMDAMCGSGELTGYLVAQGALVTGLDVSAGVIERFREKHPTATGIVASIYDTGLPDESFDCIAVSGGLHHVQPEVDAAIDEMHRLLRPGGWLVFVEPHTGSIMNALRRLWYRFDPLFEDNEQAVDLEQIERRHRDQFEVVRRRYAGGIAYLLVFNSMVFRMPHAVKAAYAPVAMGLERLLRPVATRRTACMAIGQWRKRSHAAS